MLISQWVIFGIIAVFGLSVTIISLANGSPTGSVGSLLVTIIILFAFVGVSRWYNTSTASGARAVKDQQSELSNGLERSIVVTAEDGREIYRYEGKCDIETDNDNYILFEDANHKRIIIYKGVQDTIIVSEK